MDYLYTSSHSDDVHCLQENAYSGYNILVDDIERGRVNTKRNQLTYTNGEINAFVTNVLMTAFWKLLAAIVSSLVDV